MAKIRVLVVAQQRMGFTEKNGLDYIFVAGAGPCYNIYLAKGPNQVGVAHLSYLNLEENIESFLKEFSKRFGKTLDGVTATCSNYKIKEDDSVVKKLRRSGIQEVNLRNSMYCEVIDCRDNAVYNGHESGLSAGALDRLLGRIDEITEHLPALVELSEDVVELKNRKK